MKRTHATDNLLRVLDAEEAQRGTIEGGPRGHTPVQIALRVALVLALYLAYVNGTFAPQAEEPAYVCDTDEDCAQFCPPPADDPDCDGGPQR